MNQRAPSGDVKAPLTFRSPAVIETWRRGKHLLVFGLHRQLQTNTLVISHLFLLWHRDRQSLAHSLRSFNRGSERKKEKMEGHHYFLPRVCGLTHKEGQYANIYPQRIPLCKLYLSSTISEVTSGQVRRWGSPCFAFKQATRCHWAKSAAAAALQENMSSGRRSGTEK